MPFGPGAAHAAAGAGATNIGVNFTSTGSEDQLAADLEAAIIKAMGVAARTISTALRKALKDFGSGQASTQFQKNVTGAVNKASVAMGKLQDRIDSVEKTMRRIGASSQEFETLIRQTHVVAESFDDMRAARERAARDPGFQKQIIAETEAAQKLANNIQRSTLKEVTVAETAFKKEAEQRRISEQTASQAAKREAAERIVTMQTEAAREVALTKAGAQRRVEVLRIAANQIRALERGLAAIFRGTANAIAGAFRGLGGALNTVFSAVTSRLRRSNVEMTAGLDSSLTKRESILRSSFSRQESIISSSVRRQQIATERLDRQVSTGILGAATGRSRVGQALGLGAAFSGGFALISGLKNLVTASADFEQGLAVLQAQLGLTDKQMVSVRQTAIDLGNDLSLPGVSAKQGAEAIQILTKQFGSLGKGAVPAAQAAAKGVLQLSRATQSSAEDAAALVGTAVNVFGVSASKAVSVADEITGALTKAAGVGFGDFSLAFKQAASVFAQFQVPAVGAKEALIDFNTAIAVLARGGLIGSDAGTSLKQFFLQANRGTKDSVTNLKKLTERAGETGTAFFDAAGKARPLSESLEIMRKGLQGLTDQERNKTLQKIFGSDAIRAANILLGTSEKTFDTIEKGVRKTGLAAEIAAAQNTGLRGAMDALNSVIETMALEVLPKITVPLGNFVLAFAGFITNVRDGEGVFKIIRDGLKGIAVGLGAILAVKAGVEVIRLLGTVLPTLITPFGLLVAAVAGLSAAFFILRDNSEILGKPLKDLQARIRDFAGKGIDFLKARFDTLLGFLTGTVLPGLQHFVETIGTFFVDVFQGSDFNDQLAQLSAGIDTRTLGEKIGDKIRDIFGVARRVVGNVQELLGDLFFGVDFNDAFTQSITGQDTRSASEKLGGRIREVFLGAFRVVRDTIRSVVGNIQELLGDLVFGTDFADAFAFSITGSDTRSTFERIGGKVREIIQPVIDGVKGALDDIANLILDFDLGKALRIGGVIAAAFAGFTIAGPVGAAIAGAGSAIGLLFGDSLGKGILETLGNIGSLVVGALKGPFEAIKGFVTGFFTLDNLRSVTAAFLDLVEQIGFIIGNIVTDPRVIAVIAGLGALAVAAAFRFVQGLIEGLNDNLPQWGRLLLTGLEQLGRLALQGLAEVFSNPQILLTALGTIFVGTRLLSMFRTAGADGGRSFMAGFKQSAFSGALRGGGAGTLFGSGGAFLTGLIGSPGSIQAAVDRELSRTTNSASREVSRMRTLLKISGKDFIGPRTQAEVSKAFSDLSRTLGPAGIAGLQLRAAMKATFESLRTLSLDPLRQLGKGTITAMATLGKNMAGALAAGFAGFQTGRALAKSGLFEQILGIGGLALAVGAVNVPAGIAAGALGALGVVVTNLAHPISNTTELLKGLIEQLHGVADPIPIIVSTIVKEFGKVGPAVQDALIIGNFDSTRFIEGIREGTTTGVEEFRRIIGTLDPDMKAIIDLFDQGTLTAKQLFEQLGKDPKLNLTTDQVKELFDFVVGGGTAATGALKEFDKEQKVTGKAAEEGGKKAAKGASGWQKLIDRIKETTGIDISKIFGGGLNNAIGATTTTMEALRQKSDETKSKIEELFQVGVGGPTTLQGALDDFVLALPGIASQLESVLFPPEGVTVPQQFIDATRNKTGAALSEALGSIVVAAGIKNITGVKKLIDTQIIPAIQAEVAAGRIKPKVGMELVASLQKVVLDPAFLADLRKAFANQKAVDAQLKVRAQLKADKLTKAQMDAVMAAILGGGTGPAHPLVGTPFVVHVPIKGVPKGTPITVEQYVNALLGEDGKPPVIPLDVPVKLNPVQTTPFKQLTPKQVKDLVGLGPQGLTGGTGDTAIDVPVAATPVITMLAPSAGTDLTADVLRVLGLDDPVNVLVINMPVSVVPTITTASSGTLSLQARVLQALGVSRGVRGVKINVPVAIVPKLTIRKANIPDAEDLRKVLGLKLVVINVPVQINPQVQVSGGATQGAAGIGTGIAAAVAQGVAAGAPLIAVALAVGLGRALQASGDIANQFRAVGSLAARQVGQGIQGSVRQLSSAFRSVGAEGGAQLAAGILSQRGSAASAGVDLGASAVSGAADGASGMFSVGDSAGASFVSGVASNSGFSAGASLGSSAVSGASGYSLYSTGLNLANSMASGILAGKSSVINAAISIAQAAIDAARRTLESSSPSKVFRKIGRDVGKGFALGIQDEESSVVSAMQTAVSKAIEEAQNAIKIRQARATGAAELFRQTQLPSRLPGGPTLVDVIRALDAARQGVADFRTGLGGQVRDLRRDARSNKDDLRDRLSERLKEIKENLGERLDKIAERIKERAATAFDRPSARIDVRRERLNLQGLGFDLRAALRESMKFEVKVGEGDDAKTVTRRSHSLDFLNKKGRENANVILDMGQRIRDFGKSLLDNGATARQAVGEMKPFIKSLVDTAVSMGFNRDQVERLLRTLGLSNEQLKNYVNGVGDANAADRERIDQLRQDARERRADLRERINDRRQEINANLIAHINALKTLSASTEAGRANRAAILDSLQSIRDFGAEAFNAGNPVKQVVARMKELRNGLIKSATALGLPVDQVKALVETMGLSNRQLAEFVKQLKAMNGELDNTPPTPPTPGTPGTPGALPGPLVGSINISVPYGDPEAISLAVVNRFAFDAA